MNIDRNMLVSYDTFNSCCTKRQKTVFFVMNFHKNSSKLQFYENADKNLIYVWFVCHLTLSTLWYVYSFAYDRFNWRDGIRYSYISFCAKSASISLVDFSVDIVMSKTCFGEKLKIELKFICAKFQIFSALGKHDTVNLVSISHGNRSQTSYLTVGELRSGVTGFATIYATGSHRLLVCTSLRRKSATQEQILQSSK